MSSLSPHTHTHRGRAVLNWSRAHSTDSYRQIRDLIYSHIRRMCPALWEEPVGTQQPVGPLWLSAPLFLWMTERGWSGLLWVLLLGELLHAGKERLLESWHEIQKATQTTLKKMKKYHIIFICLVFKEMGGGKKITKTYGLSLNTKQYYYRNSILYHPTEDIHWFSHLLRWGSAIYYFWCQAASSASALVSDFLHRSEWLGAATNWYIQRRVTCVGGERGTARVEGRFLQSRKSESHPLLKTQHILWLKCLLSIKVRAEEKC